MKNPLLNDYPAPRGVITDTGPNVPVNELKTKSDGKEHFKGYWSINYTPDQPDQFCLWKLEKPKLIYRIFNWYLLGNKWIDTK